MERRQFCAGDGKSGLEKRWVVSLHGHFAFDFDVQDTQTCTMSSRGKEETRQLVQKTQEQLNRLLLQLSDVEELKADLEPEVCD